MCCVFLMHGWLQFAISSIIARTGHFAGNWEDGDVAERSKKASLQKIVGH